MKSVKHSRRRNRKMHRRSRHHKRQLGGYGPGAGPVGAPWTHDPMSWPGVLAANGANTQGITSSNYLPLSPYGIAVGGAEIAVPEVGYKGGRKSRKQRKGLSRRHQNKSRRHHRRHSRNHSRRHRGGFGPQELINFGRDLKFQAKTAYDAFMGNEAPVDPSPLVQPINENYKVIEPTPINLPRSFSLAGDSVAPL